MPVQYPRWPRGSRPPRVAIEFQANEKFFSGVEQTARRVVQEIAAEVKEQARRNVTPGVGPGPHPHKPTSHHVDTGNLMRSIFYRTYERSGLVGAMIGTPINYGLFLELGWHAASGAFYRYPWLEPALREKAPASLESALVRFRF
jgi:hypothetical protein